MEWNDRQQKWIIGNGSSTSKLEAIRMVQREQDDSKGWSGERRGVESTVGGISGGCGKRIPKICEHNHVAATCKDCEGDQ